MSEQDVWVVASFTCKEGALEEIVRHIAVLVSAVQQEPGCLKYDCYRDTKNPRAFTFIEHWASQGDLDVHGSTATMARWRGVSENLRESGTTVQVLMDIER